MAALGGARGCVYRVGNGGAGFCRVNGLSTGTGQYPILIVAPGMSLSDIVQPVSVFGGKNLMYVYGKDMGSLQLSGSILLGPAGSSATGVSQVHGFFQSSRAFNGGSISVSLPGGISHKVYMHGLTFGNLNPEYNILDFSIRGSIAEPGS